MKKIAIFFASFASIVSMNAQNLKSSEVSPELKETLNNSISDNSAAQSNGYNRYATITLADGNTIVQKASFKPWTGWHVGLKGGYETNAGVGKPVFGGLFGHRSPWGAIEASYTYSPSMEKNSDDINAGASYGQHSIAGTILIKVYESKGTYPGTFRLNIYGGVGATSFEHNKNLGEFLRTNGTVDSQETYHNGWSIMFRGGIRAEACVSKSKAIFVFGDLGCKYANDPFNDGQISKPGLDGQIGAYIVLSNTHYSKYGKVLKEAGALNARINAERSKANNL